MVEAVVEEFAGHLPVAERLLLRDEIGKFLASLVQRSNLTSMVHNGEAYWSKSSPISSPAMCRRST